MDGLDAGRVGQVDRPADQRHACARRGGSGGDGVALFARRAVGDVAHRVDRLMRRPGRDQDMPAGERAGRGMVAARQPAEKADGARRGLFARQRQLDRGEDFRRLGHAARATLAALGHGAAIGPDDEDAVPFELSHVPPRRRMLPHARIHRRRDQHALVGGEQGGRGKVVGMAVRHLGDQVGGRRRDHQEVRRARELDMADIGFVGQREQVGEAALARQRRDRERSHELLASLGQDAARGDAAILQPADEFEHLVGGDAAADDQKNGAGSGQGGSLGGASCCRFLAFAAALCHAPEQAAAARPPAHCRGSSGTL